MSIQDPIEIFLDLIEQTGFESLSDDTIAAAKTFLLDTASVALAGTLAPKMTEMLAAAQAWDGASPNGIPIWNSTARASAPVAALINGYQCHALEFDCVYEPGVILPTAPILAAIHGKAVQLTRAGKPPSGKDLIRAFVVALEVSCTMASAARNSMFFFRPTTTGVFSALTALACLDPLPRDQLRYAFGIGYSQVSGTMQSHEEGSMMLAMQMGFAARNAVQAHQMAALGITAPVMVLGGRFGFFKVFESSNHLDELLPALGKPWKVTRLSHKPFPSGRVTHGVIHTLSLLSEQLKLTPDKAFESIKSIRVELPPLGFRLTGRPMVHQPTPNYARLCIPFVAAAQLLLGAVDPRTFVPDILNNSKIETLARRVVTVEVPHDDPNAFYPQTIRIEFADGAIVTRDIPIAWGHPDMPLSQSEREAKFRLCCKLARRVDAKTDIPAESFMLWMAELESAATLEPLFALLAGTKTDD